MKLNEQGDPVTHVLSESCNPCVRLHREGVPVTGNELLEQLKAATEIAGWLHTILCDR